MTTVKRRYTESGAPLVYIFSSRRRVNHRKHTNQTHSLALFFPVKKPQVCTKKVGRQVGKRFPIISAVIKQLYLSLSLALFHTHLLGRSHKTKIFNIIFLIPSFVNRVSQVRWVAFSEPKTTFPAFGFFLLNFSSNQSDQNEGRQFYPNKTE